MATVHIIKGISRGKEVINQSFTLLKGYTPSSVPGEDGFVTVDGMALYGRPKARIRVKTSADYVITGQLERSVDETPVAEFKMDVDAELTNEQIRDRINRKFATLDKLTLAARRGEIKSVVVTGAPGVGKTFGVQAQLESAGLAETFSDEAPKYQIVSGRMTGIGLYAKLFAYRHENNVLVLDDCDVWDDEVAVNVLKTALDTGKKRMIHWNADSAKLRREKIQDNFEFKGSVIFITNTDVKAVHGNKAVHIKALMSRSHYLDLTISTEREKLIRIEDLAVNRDMLAHYDLSDEMKAEIMQFLRDHASEFNELSLRTVIKLADLAAAFSENSEWKEIAMESMIGNKMA